MYTSVHLLMCTICGLNSDPARQYRQMQELSLEQSLEYRDEAITRGLDKLFITLNNCALTARIIDLFRPKTT